MADDDDQFVSVMEGHPDHVRAIGMISIELADLEQSLADLLAALLDVSTEVAQAIYFTPKATIPRVEVLSNVHAALHPDEDLDEEEVRQIRAALKNMVKRAKKVMGKRNDLLHAAWGELRGDDGELYYGPLPLKEGRWKPAKLIEIKRVVSDIRELNKDVYELVDLIGAYRGRPQ